MTHLPRLFTTANERKNGCAHQTSGKYLIVLSCNGTMESNSQT